MKIFDYADLGDKYSWDYSSKGITPETDGVLPIIETNKMIEMGDVLIIDDVVYAVSSMSGKGDTYYAAYVERLKTYSYIMKNQ